MTQVRCPPVEGEKANPQFLSEHQTRCLQGSRRRTGQQGPNPLLPVRPTQSTARKSHWNVHGIPAGRAPQCPGTASGRRVPEGASVVVLEIAKCPESGLSGHEAQRRRRVLP